LAIEVDCSKVQHALRTIEGPAHACAFQPVFYQVSARSLGDAAADGIAGGQVLVVAHVLSVILEVVNHRRQRALLGAVQQMLVLQPLEMTDHVAHFTFQQLPQMMRDKSQRISASFAMKQMGHLPEPFQHVE